MKKLILFIAIIFVACTSESPYIETSQNQNLQRFSQIQLGIMDTLVQFIGYSYSQEEFLNLLSPVQQELIRLNQLFTSFEEVPGVNNIYTINEMAGIAPVEVDPLIIELIKIGIDAYHNTGGVINIALGSVLEIWHDARISNNPQVPYLGDLIAASIHTDINNIIIDEENSTVFLADENMSLDVGTVGKGFAIHLATEKAINLGLYSFLIDVGGDIITLNPPPGAQSWSSGIQDPSTPYDPTSYVDIIRLSNMSIFTSGNYQRYFIVDGIRYHHIIDPITLMPSNYYNSVTVIHENAILAEILSTALFIVGLEEGLEMLETLGGHALWVLTNGSIFTSPGYSLFSDNF